MTWTVFRTISKCYLYDRNINSVVEIPESDYIELNSAHISENLLEKDVKEPDVGKYTIAGD